MNVFKRYNNFNKAPAVRHGWATGVKTRDSDALARFQNRQEIHQKARASKSFVWPSAWNTAHGKATSAANINEINKAFWKKQNNDQ